MGATAFALARQVWRSPARIAVFVLQAVLVPAACHTPLATRRDASPSADARHYDAPADPVASSPTSDGPADAPGSPPVADASIVSDLAAPDVVAPEAPAPDRPDRGPSLPEVDAGIDARTGTEDASPALDGWPGEAGTCQPLEFSHFGPVNGQTRCPVDPALPECASSDVGAIVFRDETCAMATLAAHPDCALWSRPQGFAYVFLTDPFGGCGWPITLDAVLDCGDHVDIEYIVTEPCQTCDAVHPATVMLIIPTDRKPVRAIAALERERC